MAQVVAPSAHKLGAGSAEDELNDPGARGLYGVWAMLQLGRNHKMPLALAILVIFLSSAASLAAARYIGHTVDILAGADHGRPLSWTVITFLGLEILAIALIYFGKVALARTTNDIIYATRRSLVEKLGRLPVSYFDRQPMGRTITRLTADVDGIETLFSATLSRVLSALITIISVFVAMISLEPRFGLLIVISALPSLLLNYFARRVLLFWLRAHKIRNAKANATLAELLTGLQVIRLLNLEAWTKELYDNLINRHLQANISLMNWNTLVRPVTVVLCLIPTILVIFAGGRQVIDGLMPLGMFVVFVRYSERFLAPVRTISQEIHQIQDALSSSDRIQQLLSEPEESAELGGDGSYQGRIQGRVEYKNISMSYHGSRSVLKDISFRVDKGMRVGLVGESGSGKSSTINLLPRLYPYQSGTLLVDDIPIDQWNRRALRRQLGVVSQDVIIFKGTLRENLLGAVHQPSSISDSMVIEGAEKTGLGQLIRKLPLGLDTVVYQGGSNLSLGERQLIALTRMLIKDPAILLLDEATANIDEANEVLIQNAISAVMEDRTCFIIAHRLSTIIQCDLILVFRDGAIVERGNHEQLLRQDGYYAELIRQQL